MRIPIKNNEAFSKKKNTNWPVDKFALERCSEAVRSFPSNSEPSLAPSDCARKCVPLPRGTFSIAIIKRQ